MKNLFVLLLGRVHTEPLSPFIPSAQRRQKPMVLRHLWGLVIDDAAHSPWRRTTNELKGLWGTWVGDVREKRER